MKSVIVNPKELPKIYSSWMNLYREAKKNNLLVHPSFLISFREPIDSRVDFESITVKVYEYEIFISFLKQKCFDEIESKQPEDLTMDMCNQLKHAAFLTKEQFKIPIHKWMLDIAIKQQEYLYETKQY